MMRLIKKYYGVFILSMILILMIFLNFQNDSLTLYDKTRNISCLISCLFGIMLYWHIINIGVNKFFKYIVLIEIFRDFSIMIICSVQGEPKYSSLLFYLYTFSYMLYIGFVAMCWMYIKSLLNQVEHEKLLDYAVFFNNVVAIVCLILNIFTRFLFYVNSEGYVESILYDTMGIVHLCIFYFSYIAMIFSSDAKPRLRFSLLTYVFFPIIFDICEFSFADISYLTDLDAICTIACELASLYIIYFNIHIYERNESIEMKNELISSQIGPHFLYNSLATISTLCENDETEMASEAINKFSDYLRMNIDSIRNNKLISFKEELEHVKTYLWLEKLRFGDDLNVIYDIKYTDFYLPPLTLQPIVENAVTHGVLMRENGGTIKISTKVIKDDIVIIAIEDDGVGFDTNVEENDRFGIYSIRERLKNYVNGELRIESEVGKGTIVRIIL